MRPSPAFWNIVIAMQFWPLKLAMARPWQWLYPSYRLMLTGEKRHNYWFLHVQAVLALKGREEELRKVSREVRLSNEENRASGKVAVNAPYAVIVTPGRELADQVGSCDFDEFYVPTLFQNNHSWRHWVKNNHPWRLRLV